MVVFNVVICIDSYVPMNLKHLPLNSHNRSSVRCLLSSCSFAVSA